MIQEPTFPMRRLFRYLAPYRKALTGASLASVINKVFDLMPPFLTAWVIDSLAGDVPGWIPRLTSLEDTWSIILMLTGLTLFIFGAESFFEWLFKRGFLQLAQRVQHDLRMDTYAHLQSREVAFFENQRTGNLLAILNDDINQLERFLNNSFNQIIQLITLLLFAGWALCITSLPLGLLGLTPIPFIIWGSVYYQKKIGPLYQGVRNKVGELSNRLENNLAGMRVIKSFATEDYELGRVREASLNYRDTNFGAIRWSAVYFPLIRIPITLGFAGTMLLGSYWVLFEPERFTLGSLAFFAMMIQRLLWPVTTLGVVFDEYQRAKASAKRVFGLLDTPNALQASPTPTPLPTPPGDIELDHISFHYRADQPILQNFSLTIPAGKTLGIAGPTGGGKTTLIKLLLRFYDVQDGAIRLGGIDLRALDERALRRQIALVSQDTYLFHGSIRENLAYGCPGVDFSQIEEAARRAQLHDFIATLPEGYDTIVGERGIKLSGGQRQRLSIGRAILKNAPILILDEATSAVDTVTEQAIQDNIQALSQERTAIIIAHRLSTIRQADRIIVMDQGRIIESGRHEDLILEDGAYAQLWFGQRGSEENFA